MNEKLVGLNNVFKPFGHRLEYGRQSTSELKLVKFSIFIFSQEFGALIIGT